MEEASKVSFDKLSSVKTLNELEHLLLMDDGNIKKLEKTYNIVCSLIKLKKVVNKAKEDDESKTMGPTGTDLF